MTVETNICEAAKRFAALSEQSKAIEKELTVLKATLRASGPETYALLLENLKVVVAEPTTPAVINAVALGETLIASGRKAEFLAVSKVSITDLGNLIDGAELIDKFSVEGKAQEPRVTCSALAKKDLEIIGAGGSIGRLVS